jgi:hypothetical protein
MKKWYNFIVFFQELANIAGAEACDFHPTEEQCDIGDAPSRPGKIGDESTNTKELTRDFIAKSLPNRKYNGDHILPSVILRFVNDVDFEIDTDDFCDAGAGRAAVQAPEKEDEYGWWWLRRDVFLWYRK